MRSFLVLSVNEMSLSVRTASETNEEKSLTDPLGTAHMAGSVRASGNSGKKAPDFLCKVFFFFLT